MFAPRFPAATLPHKELSPNPTTPRKIEARLEQSCDALKHIDNQSVILESASNAVSETNSQLRNTLHEIDTAATLAVEAAGSIRDATLAGGQQPDRLTYVLRGIVAGLVIAGVVASGIWYLATR